MRFWFDTEFYEDGKTIQLISIGVVSEDNRTYYAETLGARPLASSHAWLSLNVLPHLGNKPKTRAEIVSDLVLFVGPKPEFWAYYGAYDWVALCQLFGRMMDLPTDWPMYTNDIMQLANSLGNPTLPKQMSYEHHALNDALWTREAWLLLEDIRHAQQ